MKKERFKEIVSTYSSSSDEVKSLKKLASDYPFSQIIHLLLANSSKSNQSKDYKPNLTNAAFYTTDRSILKSLIENNLVPSDYQNKVAAIPSPINNPKLSKKTSKKEVNLPKSTNSDHLAEEVLKNLEELQRIKQEAVIWLDGNSKKIGEKKKPKAQKTSVKSKPNKKTSTSSGQSKIIEKFIKEEPRISKNAKPSNEKEDMAAKTSVMREDVISESLAKIFVKQGKIKKAIDIYKKLIWKFPQKKTLFAAQIEKLKKT